MLPEWAGEAVTCLSFSPDGQLLAAGGAAGTVRVWQLQQATDTAPSASPVLVAAHSSTVAAATGDAAVGAVRWLPIPGGWVLLTGNRNNASLQLWHTAGDAAAAPLEWAPLQTLRFEGKDGQSEFYNQLDVVPAQQVGAVPSPCVPQAVELCLLGKLVWAPCTGVVAYAQPTHPIVQFPAAGGACRHCTQGGVHSALLWCVFGMCLGGKQAIERIVPGCKLLALGLCPVWVARSVNPPGPPATWRRHW